MLNSKIISKILSDFIANPSAISGHKERLNQLVWLSIKTNQELWNLEDLARMAELGSEHVATTKQEIDKNNQIRNNLIREIDIEIADQIGVSSVHQERFYSESPGMIIDRLAILFIKLSVIRDLLSVIKEKDLQEEYKEKENIILKQIDRIGNFLDSYFTRLARKEAFFEILQPVKIYNDTRIREYIKILKKKKPAKQN
ncbi:DUF4254 domain-containing protein [Patescibacteria group bacterium]|nr:DUF4254 domain-containing protein [Patescibacteria group bacterium]